MKEKPKCSDCGREMILSSGSIDLYVCIHDTVPRMPIGGIGAGFSSSPKARLVDPHMKETRMCRHDGGYDKDELKQLHFYCQFCGKEMGCDEVRECSNIAPKDLESGLIELSSPQDISLRDKNGHAIDDKGNLVFDPKCHNCDAPDLQAEEEPWEGKFTKIKRSSALSTGQVWAYNEDIKSFISSTIQEAVRAKGEVLLERVQRKKVNTAYLKNGDIERYGIYNAALSEIEKDILEVMQ